LRTHLNVMKTLLSTRKDFAAMSEKRKPLGTLKTNISWKHHKATIACEYFKESEMVGIKAKLSRMSVEVIKRWMLEDGDLTLEQAKNWPQSMLNIKVRERSWLEKFWRWLFYGQKY